MMIYMMIINLAEAAKIMFILYTDPLGQLHRNKCHC